MIMKINKYMLLAAAALSMVLVGCQSNEPFDTQSADDAPLILKPYNESGTGSFTYDIADPQTPMLDSAVVTPSAYTTVNWYLDGCKVNTGLKINRSFPAGIYKLTIEAVTTQGKRTERFGTVTVHPFAVDPYSDEIGFQRHIVPGLEYLINGQNLDLATRVVFSTDVDATNQVAVADKTWSDATNFKFIAPELSDGAYFARLSDSEGTLYGANRVYVHNHAIVLDGYGEFMPGSEWKMMGLNLEHVKSVYIGNEVITDVQADFDGITFTAPVLAEGEFDLSMKNEDGSMVQFLCNGENVESVRTKVSTEVLLWAGPVSADWNENLIRINSDQFADVPVGSKIIIYWSMNSGDYHQMRIIGPWWGPDIMAQFDLTAETPSPLVVEYTADVKSIVMEQGAFCCVGFGYDVAKITWK